MPGLPYETDLASILIIVLHSLAVKSLPSDFKHVNQLIDPSVYSLVTILRGKPSESLHTVPLRVGQYLGFHLRPTSKHFGYFPAITTNRYQYVLRI